MSLSDIISLATLKSTLSTGGIIFVIIASLLQISKININPWDAILSWVGDRINKIQDTRRDILDFANACMNGRKHTKEQFDFVLKECDDYETYTERKDIKNGVVTSAIKEIRRLYDKCIQSNSFLKEDAI